MKEKSPKNTNPKFNSEEKLELAQRIARQSEKFSRRTEAIGNGFFRILRWLSDSFDKILFNPRHSKFVAFALSGLIFLALNANDAGATATLKNSKELKDVNVSLVYNEEMYEISGYDEKVNIGVIGDYSDISMVSDVSDYSVELDLGGLTEGTHRVPYKAIGFSSRIKTYIEPATAEITIRKKETKTVQLSYDFINLDKLDPKYVLGEPEFESRDVSIKASKETLSNVAFVKALIDVSGQTEEFTTEAELVAYNQQGEKIESVDIIPKKAKVKVGVSSPHKTVPVRPIFEGEVPNNKAIKEVKMDHEAITIYAPQSVLDSIDEVVVPIPAASLTDDTKTVQNVSLPSGVRFGTVSKVNMEIKLGKGISKKFDKVPINWRYNVNGYKMSPVNKDDVYTSIEVFGTEENVKKFTVDNVWVYIDMRNVEVGDNQEGKLYIESSTPYLDIKSSKESIIFNVIE
ncbi:YbbR-like domain-containing protein [Erysipelothrix urinaevulpis]|uniref:CdaR family protein n=1 Tax=Erysipelothrix urinaevulpis TaxID=2683717 RepID=UPI00135A1A21|nr:CdaR family protein [Erysipelothrix urinaevulpis]